MDCCNTIPEVVVFENMSDKMDLGSDKRTDVKARRPLWKDKLREMCLQRVRRERDRLLWDTRLGVVPNSTITPTHDLMGSAFESIVAEELHRARQQIGAFQGSELHGEDTVFSGVCDGQDVLWEDGTHDAQRELGDEEYEALMLAMEQALYEEMHAEVDDRDAALLEEYESVHAALEDESLATVMEHWQEHEEGGLLCPLCRTRRLQQSQSSIICGCGRFQIDTESDQVGLDFLQRRLAEVLQEHIDSGCRGQSTFSIQCRFGIGALYMQCPCCDCFQLIL